MKIDYDLIKDIKNGQKDKFEEVIEAYQHPIFTYCLRMLRSVHEAEDAAQEVFIKAYEKLHTYRNDISFSSWLYKIAYNHCLNAIKRKKLIKFIPFLDFTDMQNYENDPDDILINSETNQEINEILSILSPEDRSILILRVIEEKSHEEIAEVLELKAPTVRKRYERIKYKIEEYLKIRKEVLEHEKIPVL